MVHYRSKPDRVYDTDKMDEMVMEILNVLENSISQLRNTIRHCFITRVIVRSRIDPFSRSWAGLVKFRELAL